MSSDLSAESKQSFQVVALLATILVVGIHYKSDIPEFSDPHAATWNQLGQEFLFGGIARVAVPLFAFAAGLFYFRSDDGSFASYVAKFKQRLRTVGIPYLIISTIAFSTWLLSHAGDGLLHGDPREYVKMWLLHPLAEQLWFLRDLLVLIAIAPLIRLLCYQPIVRPLYLITLLVLWAANYQVFPMVAGWHLIQMETLLYFSLGCAATVDTKWIEGIGRVSGTTVVFTTALWCMLVATRITVKADFDMWYVDQYGSGDLMLHQASILVGSIALYMIAFRSRHHRLIQLSSASFFVYLVHEYPLRTIVRKMGDQLLDHDTSAWVVLPVVLIGCFSASFLLNRYAPTVAGVLTGGRTPTAAKSFGGPSSGSPQSAPAS